MNKTLSKNIIRSFKRTWARFVSVTLLIALAIFVFVGLFSAGPDMRQTVIKQFKRNNLADLQVIASDSLTATDKKALKQTKELKEISFGKQLDAEINGQGIHFISNPKTISSLTLVKGRLAKTNHEVAIGEQLHRHIGDTLTIQTDGLKVKKLKVVGIVRSSEFMSKTKLGQTKKADGSLSYFAAIPSSNFISSDNLVRMTFKNTQHKRAYTQDYANTVYKDKERVQKTTQKLTKSHQKKLLDELSKGQKEIQESSNTLKQKELQLKEAQQQLDLAAQTATSYQTQRQVASQRAQLQEQKASLVKAKARLAQKKTELTNKQKQVSLLTLTVQERSDFAQGYSDYGSSATRMDALALILPVIFFAISLMVSFTTMRRMVTEKRIELGTLRALGFTKKEVMREYTLYSTATAILGTLLGGLLGTFFLPNTIYNIFADGSYQLGKITFVYSPLLLLLSLLLSLMSTLFSAYWAARQELKERPSSLMLPKPPAITSKILLERVTFIWRRLSFSNKVTLRNAFRYKSRLLMTIFGVMGSVALLILGIGIRDSLTGLIPSQYEHLSTYDMITVYNPHSSALTSYQKLIKENSDHKRSIGYETLSVRSDSLLDSQSIQVFTANNFKGYVTLDKKPTKNGAILSQKLGHAFHLKVGDRLKVKDSEGHTYHIKVAGFTTNYVGHMIYMTPAYHEKVFHQSFETNAYLVKTTHNVEKLAKKINQQEASLTVVKSKELRQTISDFLKGLTNIILIIVFVSIMLAFIVLYTLTSINVAEREKELATIKVLGFYQREALMYIFKETFLLTILGILAGIGLGYFIHKYVMTVIPPEYVMSIPGITWTNILISSCAVIIFTLIVMLIMNRHIKKIDMLEALKSVD